MKNNETLTTFALDPRESVICGYNLRINSDGTTIKYMPCNEFGEPLQVLNVYYGFDAHNVDTKALANELKGATAEELAAALTPVLRDAKPYCVYAGGKSLEIKASDLNKARKGDSLVQGRIIARVEGARALGAALGTAFETARETRRREQMRENAQAMTSDERADTVAALFAAMTSDERAAFIQQYGA